MEDPQPALIAPTGEGYMPLYCAAQWIATAGHAVAWDVPDETVWARAYHSLLDAIASEDVKVIGEREGEKGPIPPYLFAGCEVSHHAKLYYPDTDGFYLSSSPYIDEEHWREGMGDSLIRSGSGATWKRILVLKKNVASIWPYKDAAGRTRTYGTGLPGRPSSKHLISQEHAARWERGEALEGVGAEARALCDWSYARKLVTA